MDKLTQMKPWNLFIATIPLILISCDEKNHAVRSAADNIKVDGLEFDANLVGDSTGLGEIQEKSRSPKVDESH
jgi:hypothetical protein